jgi:hypothetical protein
MVVGTYRFGCSEWRDGAVVYHMDIYGLRGGGKAEVD